MSNFYKQLNQITEDNDASLNEKLEKTLLRQALELITIIRHEARSNPSVPKSLERNTFRLEKILLNMQDAEMPNRMVNTNKPITPPSI